MDYFLSLPDGCISEIFSYTSQKDAVRSSIVSRGFKSIVESDAVWENFLPYGYQDFINISESFLVYSSKKELYFSLCNSPILLDGSKLSFSLDKKTGKKCFTVAPKELDFSWKHKPHYWGLSFYPESRFTEAAHLPGYCWIDIHGKIDGQLLSKRTTYYVYLLFKETHLDLEIATSVVRFVNCESDNEAEERRNVGRISRPITQTRDDEWMEIKMGNFFNDTGEYVDVEVRLRSRAGIGGFFAQGIEFRPE